MFVSTISKNKRIIWAIFFFTIAILTHKSVAISIPFIFLVKFNPFSRKIWIMLLLVTYVLSALDLSFVTTVLNFFAEFVDMGHYEGYTDINFGQIDAKGWFNMNLLPFMILSFLILVLKNDKEIKIWIYQMALWGAVLNNVFYDNLMWSRLILYFSIFMIMAIPNALYNRKLIIQFPIFALIMVYYIYKTSSQLIDQVDPFATGNLVIPYHSWLFDPIFG